MLSPPSVPGPARLPGYDLGEPTEADARASLERVFGSERGGERWLQACRDAGLVPGRVTTTQLLRAAQALTAQGGPAAVVARSIEIRIRTFARLSANAAAAAGRQG